MDYEDETIKIYIYISIKKSPVDHLNKSIMPMNNMITTRKRNKTCRWPCALPFLFEFILEIILLSELSKL